MKNTDLTTYNEKGLVSELDNLIQDTKDIYMQQISYGTSRAYANDWNLFTKWCAENNFKAEQATSSNISLFLTHHFKKNNRNPSTINRRLAAIKFWFKSQNIKSPINDEVVHAVLKGIRRDKKVKLSNPKKSNLKRNAHADS